ncbi:ATP-binding protein [Paenibacillus antarcticus]|uniref:histidine kinase n=1 Tax=Paenibacillus antarcticus TaxID=253703 RepID=A0A168QL36_9BACL|nr:ATP-binding protein [Paenibacillus antarcticus]OAB47908.1 PAS domain-containing sensor histidine kinase [Paenibacillus antarcticus]
MLPNASLNYDFIFKHAKIGMAIISLTGKFIKVNSTLCELLGYEQHELISLPSQVNIYQDQIDELLKYGQFMASKNVDQHQFEQYYSHRSGNRLYITMNVSIVRDITGIPQFYFIQFEDKTFLSHMESLLQSKESNLIEKEDSFRQLLEKIPQSVFITQKGIVQYVNPAALRLVHATNVDEVIGISTTVVVDESCHAQLYERERIYENDHTLAPICYLINCFNGQQKLIDGFSLTISYEGKRAVAGIFEDITQQKLQEEQILQSEKLSTVGQLAAGIAHEIRNPLTAINGFMKLLRTSDHNKELYFEIIESELKRIEFIVNELLILSKPQASHTSKSLNILPILEHVITLMNVQAALNNIEIIPLFTMTPIWIAGDINQLKQAFINLLKNAMEAMNYGGTIRITVYCNAYEVQIAVQDEGIGMSPEQIKSLGQPFYSTKDKGTGLGFMITQNIIHNHGGTIAVESVLQQGTTFIVTLPIIAEIEE